MRRLKEGGEPEDIDDDEGLYTGEEHVEAGGEEGIEDGEENGQRQTRGEHRHEDNLEVEDHWRLGEGSPGQLPLEQTEERVP